MIASETETLYQQYVELINATRFEEALKFSEQAQFEAELEGDAAMNAVALQGISYAYTGMGDFPKAQAFAERAYQAAIESKNDRIICDMLNSVGGLEVMFSAKFDSGREKHLKALEIARDIHYEGGISSAQRGIGTSYTHQGQLATALKHLQEALRHANDSRTRAFAHNALGNYYLIARQPIKAEDHYREALQYCRLGGDRMNEVMMLTNIGHANARQVGIYGFQKAFEHFQKALQLAQEMGYAYGEVASRHAIGKAHLQLLEYEKALPHLSRASELATELQIKPIIALALDDLRDCYAGMKQYDEAIKHGEALITVMREDTLHQIWATLRLATVYRAQGDFGKAYSSYRRALALCRENRLYGLALRYSLYVGIYTINDLRRILVYFLNRKS